MTCFNPMEAWRIENHNKLVFVKPKNEKNVIEKLHVPCGKCIGCLLDRSNDWSTRIWCECQNWKNNCFITLTYNNKHLPKDGQLAKDDLQKFWKRLRYYEKGMEEWENPKTGKIEKPIRYYSCGEYGPKHQRPHYHACIFNWKPKDLKPYKQNFQGDWLYTSKKLSKIWGKGYVIIGNVNYQSACYVARYCTKKFYGQLAKKIYEHLKPEFTESSRNGGIGIIKWLNDKNKIIENQGIFIKIKDTVKLKPIPKFFMKKWKETDPLDAELYVFEKIERALENRDKILSQTTLNESEYLKLQERNLLEKAKFLRRDKYLN